MKTFAISTLGCKVNQYESQQIRELLETLGLNQVAVIDRPELVVVNTCCVTHTASAKSRQCVRKAQKLNPNAAIVVCGCLATAQTGEAIGPAANVHFIGRQDDIAATLGYIVDNKTSISTPQGARPHEHTIIRAESGAKIKHKKQFSGWAGLPQLRCFKGQTRAFLKVQDGCDGFCSYCIIPKTRPNVRSKPPGAVLEEAHALVRAGHREIVITGIFLGAYGQKSVRRNNWDGKQSDELAILLEKTAKIRGLARIRVSSLEPTDVTGRLLDAFCKHRNVMPHLHLSLQSGSNAVLRRMRRQYTTDDFRRTVEAIRSHLDRPAITTDVIVGFPGETDADFEQTIGLAREVGFAKMHVFSFSPRRGTAAAVMRDAVDKRVVKERSRILQGLEIELGRQFREQFVGETAEIIVESSNGQPCGRSERYLMVYLKNGGWEPHKNELVRAKLTQNTANGMLGEAVRS
jgi:threonylcarbamoyladenosine tRNA methylthiotransferase MtaB